MDGNNGIDPDAHGDVDHNVGTLPVFDFVLDPIAPAYRGHLLLSDPYPLFPSRANWDKLVADLNLERYPDIPLNRDRLGTDEYGNWDFHARIDHYNGLVSNADRDPVADAHEHANKLAMAIIDRHLQAAYAEVAATLLGAAGDDSEGDPDTETKTAPEADDSFDCWS